MACSSCETPQVRFDYDYSLRRRACARSEDSLERSTARPRRHPVRPRHLRVCRTASEGSLGGPHPRADGRRAGWRASMNCGDGGVIGDRCRRQRVGAVREVARARRSDLFLIAGRYTLLEQAPLDTLFPQCASAAVWGSSPVARITQASSRAAATLQLRGTRRPMWWRARARWTPCASHIGVGAAGGGSAVHPRPPAGRQCDPAAGRT